MSEEREASECHTSLPIYLSQLPILLLQPKTPFYTRSLPPWVVKVTICGGGGKQGGPKTKTEKGGELKRRT